MKIERPGPAVTVVGSVHMDLIAAAARLPRRGETLPGKRFAMHAGGKAGNQAVQVARAGVTSFIVGRVGNDLFGERLRASLHGDGVDVTYLSHDPAQPTGASTVLIGEDGDYASVIVPGASLTLGDSEIEAAAGAFARSNVLLLQLEIAVEATAHAAAAGRSFGHQVILNVSPAPTDGATLPSSLWPNVDIVLVNAVETEMLSGQPAGNVDQVAGAAHTLSERFRIPAVVATIGGMGVLVVDEDGACHLAGWPMTVVDTVGAGDAFAGTLAAGLATGLSLIEASRRANAAGALAVTGHGAQDALPSAAEVDAFLQAREASASSVGRR